METPIPNVTYNRIVDSKTTHGNDDMTFTQHVHFFCTCEMNAKEQVCENKPPEVGMNAEEVKVKWH
jgi:hypothetical protein